MKLKLWTIAACGGALGLGFAVAEAQQTAPGGPRIENPSGVTPQPIRPAAPRLNFQPGATAQPAAGNGQRTTVQRPDVDRPPRIQLAPQLDAAIAAQLAIGNAEEIAIARIGERRADDREVREFARRMIDEHREFLDRLNRVQPDMVATFGRVPVAAAELDNQSSEPRTTLRVGDEPGNRLDNRAGERASEDSARQLEAPRDASNEAPRLDVRNDNGRAAQRIAEARARYADADDPRRLQAQRGPIDMTSSPFLHMQREIAERCLTAAERELEGKDGAEFDMAFMGMQIVAHNRMLATLQAAQRHASPQMTGLLEEGIETTEQHLAQAREIVGNLHREQDRTASRDKSRQ